MSSCGGIFSGSSAIAARMSASVIFRSRAQSVLPADDFPVERAFAPGGRTSRDDAPRAFVLVDIDDRNFLTFGDAECNAALFIIIVSFVGPFKDRAFKYQGSNLEANSVFARVGGICCRRRRARGAPRSSRARSARPSADGDRIVTAVGCQERCCHPRLLPFPRARTSTPRARRS